MTQIPEPQAGEDVRDLHKAVASCVRVINNLGNCDVNTDAKESKFVITEGNVRLDLDIPNSGGGGSGGLGPCVFAGTASGELAYFLVNCDGVAYSSPPSGYSIANPP